MTLKSRSNPRLLFPRQMHPRCKFVDRRSADSRDRLLHIRNFVIALKPMKVGIFVCNQGSLVGQCMQGYKYLCTAITICTTLFVPKFDLSILSPEISKSRSNPRHLLHPCQIHPQSKFGDRRAGSCRDNADISILMMT